MVLVSTMVMLLTATVLTVSNRSCVVTDRGDAPAGRAAGVTLRCVRHQGSYLNAYTYAM